MLIQPVILAGGGGTRLWPLSREYYPKQFLTILSDKTLLQNTLTRVTPELSPSGDIEIDSPIIICNEEHRFLVAEQSAQIGVMPNSIILEPRGRNTAPALTCAALHLVNEKADSIIIMMPADHIIKDLNLFQDTVLHAAILAKDGSIITFGIVPDQPETGYGYIEKGEKFSVDKPEIQSFHLKQFVEKPDSARAQTYLESGNYFWNSGIFMMRVDVWLDAIGNFRPDILAASTKAYEEGKQDGNFYRLNQDKFMDCPSESIDYAVMEKINESGKNKSLVVALDAGWSDIGSWSSIYNISDKSESGNVLIGDAIQVDTSNSFIRSESRLVASVGCNDLIIIETADSVLVMDKEKAQDVKSVVQKLKDTSREEYKLHRKVYRPWGSYESLDVGHNYQVKRLTVNPGKKLSLQLHHRRAEHWVVVAGEATVTRGQDVLILSPNESIYIPLETRHRLENKGNIPLEVVEVQSGDYLGEDDIVRFDDDFGRKTV